MTKTTINNKAKTAIRESLLNLCFFIKTPMIRRKSFNYFLIIVDPVERNQAAFLELKNVNCEALPK